MEITCKNLGVGYEGKTVLSNLNFSIREGDYLCIIGENGAGKSTLMKTMLGLIPPIKGEILTSEGLSLKQIGYLPQQSLTQRDFPASVKEIVLSGCLNHTGLRPFFSKEQNELAQKAMERMQIKGLENRCYRELSGGQQQRVLLARALCAAEKVLLLDEPAAGLDPVATKELYSLIKELNKKDGMTIIMISHDTNALMHDASHILYISKNYFFGTKEQYLISDIARVFSYEEEHYDR